LLGNIINIKKANLIFSEILPPLEYLLETEEALRYAQKGDKYTLQCK